MTSSIRIHHNSAAQMSQIPDESVELLLTSPPYPMIQMWDDCFCHWNPDCHNALATGDGNAAFELMHSCLDSVWQECARVLRPGALACINIGDATRSINGSFRLYQNHVRIASCFQALGFESLPLILWRKPTNSPTKFMGSGMYPSGAYVTLEHEYILIFRKGGKRKFGPKEAATRRASAFFWEERNSWFSDLWQPGSERQKLSHKGSRERSAAFPLELAHRLVNMYSLQGETVLDPFMGTGTTAAACLLNARSCIGYEIDAILVDKARQMLKSFSTQVPQLVFERLQKHIDFMHDYCARKGPVKYTNSIHNIPVISKQETEICLRVLSKLTQNPEGFNAEYAVATAEDTARIGLDTTTHNDTRQGHDINHQLSLDLKTAQD